MPYNKPRKNMRRKNYRRKKAYNRYQRKRRVKYGRAAQSIVKMGNLAGIPDALFCKLNYVLAFNQTGAPAMDWRFRANGLFAPDFTGLSPHQPLYFDQYSALYSRYRVYGCKIRLDISNQSNLVAAQVCVVPRDDSTVFANLTWANEFARSRNTKMIPVVGNSTPVRIYGYCSTRKAMGFSKTEAAANEDIAAPTTANPLQIWWWHIIAGSIDGLANINLVYLAKLTFYVRFYEVINTPQS